MRPLTVTVEGIKELGNQVFDFTTYTSNLALVISDNIENIKDMLFLGFYGEGKEGKIKLTYEYNGQNYAVERDFENKICTLTCLDSEEIFEGEYYVNSLISQQIKMNGKAFKFLFEVKKDEILNAFLSEKVDRYLYLQNIIDLLIENKSEIHNLEKKIKDKYEKIKTNIEIMEDVDPNKLSNLKEKIEAAVLKKEEIKAEQKKLLNNIYLGEIAQEAQNNIEKNKEKLNILYSEKEKLDIDQKKVASSKESGFYINLIKNKEILVDKNIENKNALEILNNQLKEDKININNGEKTIKELEEIMLKSIERNKALHKNLYDEITEFQNGEQEISKEIFKHVDSYYENQNEEEILLTQRKKDLDNEYFAVSTACEELEKKIKNIKIPATEKKAIREGSLLENKIKILKENIVSSKINIEKFNKKLTILTSEIVEVNERLTKNKIAYSEIENKTKAGFENNEEAINNDILNKQELYKNHILVVTQEQSINAITKKINENLTSLTGYYEDYEALQKAKDGLNHYLQKIKIKNSEIEEELLKLNTDLKFISKLKNVAYGEKCPVCKGIVLNKSLSEKEEKIYNKKYEKLLEEKTKLESVITDYKSKFENINTKLGELKARIKISEAYIQSLRETTERKKVAIQNVLNKSGVENSYELVEKLKGNIIFSNELQEANRKYYEIKSEIELEETKLQILTEEKNRMEESVLPKEMEIYTTSTNELKKCQEKYAAVSQILNSSIATEKLEELTLKEKEIDTLEKDLEIKKIKKEELYIEKEKIDRLLPVLKNRRKSIEIDGKEYTYKEIILKTASNTIFEIVKEIEKNENETEQIKFELFATKKIYNQQKDAYENKIKDYENLKYQFALIEKTINTILNGFDCSIADLTTVTSAELEKFFISEDDIDKIEKLIVENKNQLIIINNKIEIDESTLTENNEFYEKLNINKQKYEENEIALEDITKKIAYKMAKRKTLKSKAKQKIALIEKSKRYENKVKLLSDIIKIFNENADLADYLVRVSSRRIYSISQGKYNLELLDDELKLIDNRKAGKIITKENFTNEEKSLISLILGTTLHRALIDMIGAEHFMLLFPLKKEEINKRVAQSIIDYAKKTLLMVVCEDKKIYSELEKVM